MKEKLLIAAFFLLWLRLPALVAQGNHPSNCPIKPKFDVVNNRTILVDCHGKTVSNQAIVQPTRQQEPSAAPMEQATIEKHIDPNVEKSQNEFLIWQNNYTRRIFDHQDTYTFFIFLIVNLLVLAGLYFAWIQFNATLHLSRHIQSASQPARTGASGDQTDSKAEDKPPATESVPWTVQQLKIGTDGIAISSSFIGLIILGFS